MALFPVHANERDATGLFRAHSSFAGGEGGLVVRVTSEAGAKGEKRPVVAAVAAGVAANTAMHGLLDEQLSGVETLLGSFLPSNSAPVALGPATHLSSGRATVWQNSGYFLTDNFAIELDGNDGYGEAANLATGAALLCVNEAGGPLALGTLCDAQSAATASQTTGATRCSYVALVDDVDDLLAGRVSPAPTAGMFARGPKILIYQA